MEAELKALSIRQPWALLIMMGLKTIETREWQTRLQKGSQILLHAGKDFDHNAAKHLTHLVSMAEMLAAPRGVIIGIAEFNGTIEFFGGQDFASFEPLTRCSIKYFAPTRYGWKLRPLVHIKHPWPCKGKLGLFPIPTEEFYRNLPYRWDETNDDLVYAPASEDIIGRPE